MSVAELKNNLHRLIVETNDTDRLLKVQDLLIEPESEASKLSDYEIQRIEKGLKDIEEGRVHTNAEVKAQFREWVKKNS